MSELEELIAEIKESTTQVAINRIDENRVMRSMLNDPEFSIAVYDKKGYIGQRCPRNEAVNFTKNIITATTGLDSKTAKMISEDYEFTKRDANFLLNNMRDFLSVYSSTGRKINIIQNDKTEANLYARNIPAGTKTVPDKDNEGKTKEVPTSPYIKLVSQSKRPKYLE